MVQFESISLWWVFRELPDLLNGGQFKQGKFFQQFHVISLYAMQFIALFVYSYWEKSLPGCGLPTHECQEGSHQKFHFFLN